MSIAKSDTSTSDKPDGRLVDNIIYFCRALRRAGVHVAPSQIKDLIRAVEVVGFKQKSDFFETLRACLITRPEHMAVFNQVFNLFWRDPEFPNKMMQTLLPFAQNMDEALQPKPAANRAVEAVSESVKNNEQDEAHATEEIILDAQFSFSQNERLASMDFEQMSNAEIEDAEKAISTLNFNFPKSLSRRYRSSSSGSRIDARATFHNARKSGGEIVKLVRKKRTEKSRSLIILCDISGSMSTYSRMMMHFINALTINSRTYGQSNWANIHAFTFGTKLTNISRIIGQKDPDIALSKVGELVQDWDGGTKIGANLDDFNRNWSRRVLSSDSVVLLMTDGLERDGIDLLESQIRRLKLSCGHLIWLNPLLRFNEFEPLASGIKTMLPHVDKIVSCHNINSLTELSTAFNVSFAESALLNATIG